MSHLNFHLSCAFIWAANSDGFKLRLHLVHAILSVAGFQKLELFLLIICNFCKTLLSNQSFQKNAKSYTFSRNSEWVDAKDFVKFAIKLLNWVITFFGIFGFLGWTARFGFEIDVQVIVVPIEGPGSPCLITLLLLDDDEILKVGDSSALSIKMHSGKILKSSVSIRSCCSMFWGMAAGSCSKSFTNNGFLYNLNSNFIYFVRLAVKKNPTLSPPNFEIKFPVHNQHCALEH